MGIHPQVQLLAGDQDLGPFYATLFGHVVALGQRTRVNSTWGLVHDSLGESNSRSPFLKDRKLKGRQVFHGANPLVLQSVEELLCMDEIHLAPCLKPFVGI